jgi:hypothetical protein
LEGRVISVLRKTTSYNLKYVGNPLIKIVPAGAGYSLTP